MKFHVELQPKFRSSIRDIFIFGKLSWGLEKHLLIYAKTIQNLKNDSTLFKN